MRVLTVMVLVLLLSGCTISTPGVHARIGEPTRVYIDGYHDHGGRFCPPGQRMKGNC